MLVSYFCTNYFASLVEIATLTDAVFCFFSLQTGAVEVGYRAMSGSVSDLGEGQSLATPGQDFIMQDGVVRLENSQQSTVITIEALDVSYYHL